MEPLAELGGPPYYIAEGSLSALTNWTWAHASRSAGFVTRIVRGTKMRTTQSLFDEFGAAMQFPYYFGENWNAFDECISDLSWVSAKGYMIAVSSANEVLVESDPSEFRCFYTRFE